MVEKQRKLIEYLEKRIVGIDDIFVIAINGYLVNFSQFDVAVPRIVKCLFGVGYQFITINPHLRKTVDTGWSRRENILKLGGSSVNQNLFSDSKFECISAVIFSNNTPQNLLSDKHIDMVIHNPLAKNKLPLDTLRANREVYVKEDRIVGL